MANMLFSSALQLVCFKEKHHGVSERTVVINQGQRAAACQVVHEVRADQLQRCCRGERFAAAAGALYQEIYRMLQHAACGGNVNQHDQLAFIHDAHGLHLLNHAVDQVWRLREVTHRGP